MSNDSPGSIGSWDPQNALPSPQDAVRRALPEPPRFPSFQELVQQDALAQLTPAPKVSRGVFEELLGHPEPILQSAVEDPERYDAQALSLLRAIYNNTVRFSDLTPEEKALVNQATMEFFSATPSKPVPPAPPMLPTRPRDAEGHDAEPVDGPVLDAFWWT